MKKLLTVLLAVLWAVSLKAQYTLSYQVKLDTVGHYLLVDLTYKADNPAAEEVTLNLPRWTPGYYEIMDYAKHLADFCASDAAGNAIAWKKEGMNRWKVTLPRDGVFQAAYRVYANRRDVGSSRVESEIAFVAPAGVFMHVDGDLNHPVKVTFELPSGWSKVSSGLLPDNGTTFTAPDFDTLYDSPFLLGNYATRHFIHKGHSYDFALETPDGLEDSGFEADFRSIVSAATRLMGDVPYDNYCLIHLGQGGGGLEHLNSQACYTDGTYRFPSRRAYLNFMGFTAHEYFHLYNVKCIRPAELWPFNYDREAVTPMLWVSEGLTCYYEFRLLRDSGIASADESLEQLNKYFGMYAPFEGQRHASLRQSSYDIWLNFMNADENERDVRVNYYFKGPVVGLLMDVAIRRKSGHSHSLDDVMRTLYYRCYKEEKRGFTEEEFWTLVADVAGGPVDDIRRLVDTTDDIDYNAWLEGTGLKVDTENWRIGLVDQPAPAEKAFLKELNLLD